jgi:hypothetical protein
LRTRRLLNCYVVLLNAESTWPINDYGLETLNNLKAAPHCRRYRLTFRDHSPQRPVYIISWRCPVCAHAGNFKVGEPTLTSVTIAWRVMLTIKHNRIIYTCRLNYLLRYNWLLTKSGWCFDQELNTIPKIGRVFTTYILCQETVVNILKSRY